MASPRTARCVGVVAAVAAAAGLGLTGAAAAAPSSLDLDSTAPSWDAAAARLGTAGSLWGPTETASLDQTRTIAVLADNLAFANASATAGDTYAGTRYGRGARAFWLDEKWANTGWAAEPAVSANSAPVGPVRIRLGVPGMRTTVTARVSANCFPQPSGRK
ncbi:MAG: hypothetical protein NTX29_07945 [Actinobacteria bacterium]|nr:hypothetical protein [Actinomycetota bacterium]